MAPAGEAAGSGTRWLGLTGLCIGVFMFTLDASIVNVALPTLVKTLHTTFAMVQWVVVAYLLAVEGVKRLFYRRLARRSVDSPASRGIH